jgi:hypothetical protein
VPLTSKPPVAKGGVVNRSQTISIRQRCVAGTCELRTTFANAVAANLLFGRSRPAGLSLIVAVVVGVSEYPCTRIHRQKRDMFDTELTVVAMWSNDKACFANFSTTVVPS